MVMTSSNTINIRGYGQTFSVKGQIISILRFAGQTVSVVTTQFCHCCVSSHSPYMNEWACLYSNKNLFIKIGNGPDLVHVP